MTAKQPRLVGISVGPGDPEWITVKGLKAMEACDALYAPKAQSSSRSIAWEIIRRFQIPEEKVRMIEFEMEREREALQERYAHLARNIVDEVKAGRLVGFLTLGDALTFSTWIYAQASVREIAPDVTIETIPGVTSFSALASRSGWALGVQKQRVLVLPCPDDMDELARAIEANDLVVLMKIGHRFPQVLERLNEMELREQCLLGRKVGMDGEEIFEGLTQITEPEKLGYFSTMVIRGGAER